MSVEILPISEEYIESFCAAVDSVARERRYLAFLEGPPIDASRAFVLENLRQNSPHYVAVSNGKVVGWCDITPLNHRPVYQHSGSLGIGVLTEYRGRGIGEHLMRTALERAKEVGLTRVELTVRAPNQVAYNLYIKFGFVVEGVKRNAVKIDDEYEDVIKMALLF